MAKDYEEMEEQSHKLRNIIIIILVIVLLGGGAFAAWSMIGPGHVTKAGAVKAYFNSISDANVTNYKNTCYPKDWQNDYSKVSELQQDKVITSAIAEQKAATDDAKYKDIKITKSIDRTDELEDKLTASIKQIYGVDLEISSVVEVTINMKVEISGSTSDSGNIHKYLFKVGGKWYFLSDTLVLVNLGI